MAWFVPRETYTRTITDPESGEEATVEFRHLNAGDMNALQDTVRMKATEDGLDPEFLVGAFKKAFVQRAVVSWSLPLSVTPNTIDELAPEVFDQLFNIVNAGGAEENPTQPNNGAKSSKTKRIASPTA